MPIYEYHCKSCNHTFEELVFGEDEMPSCPRCRSVDTEKMLSRCSCRLGGGAPDSFDLPSAPASGGGCAGCSGGNCASCGH